MKLRRKHTSPQNKGGRRTGGSRPQAHTWVRQIVAASMCHVDKHNVAWAAVQGHRLRHKCELQKNAGCVVLSCSKKNFAVLYSGIVNLTNGGKYGITIRLHGSRLKGLDQRRAQPGSSICLDDDVHRHERDHGKKQNRGFVPDRIYAGAWNGSLDSQTIHPSCKKMDQKIDRLQVQCWAKIYGKVHEPMGQSLQGTCFKKNARKTEGGEKWIKEQSKFLTLILESQKLPRRILSPDGTLQLSAFGRCSWTTEMLQMQFLVKDWLIKLRKKLTRFLKNFTPKRINRLPSNPGREIAWGFFIIIIINNGIRPQAHN